MVTETNYTVIDLFSGAGGMTAGFVRMRQLLSGSHAKHFDERFRSVWANDFDKDAVATYKANFGDHCEHGDIVEILTRRNYSIPSADLVIGGPPCQGFSLLNKNRDVDPRKHLWIPFLDVVEASGANVFVMENVPQILSSVEYVGIEHQTLELGFSLLPMILLAADYGVPQTRMRAFIVGTRYPVDLATFFPPKRTHFGPKADPNGRDAAAYVADPAAWVDVWRAISDLPAVPPGTEITEDPVLNLHFGRKPTETSLSRYELIEAGGNRFQLQEKAPWLTPKCWLRKTSGGTDLFGRLWWDRPAPTIRTEFFKPEKGRYLHPVENRPITHREAARLQSFPDWFEFKGSKVQIAKQIGNAVPPLLAAHLARAVLRLLENRM